MPRTRPSLPTVLMKKILSWWRRRQIRKAQEAYAQWKARKETLIAVINAGRDPFSRKTDDVVEAAGEEAKYMERVEELMRLQ